MLFNSLQYFVFAPVVIGLYFALPRLPQRIFLLAASLYFYAAFRVPFTALLIFSIVATHFSVEALSRKKTPRGKRMYLWLAVLSNVAILYFFKFIDFSFEVWNLLLGLEACDAIYAHPTGVVLPMGISFFTLQAMAYAVDVYRGTLPAGRSLFSFALFLSFFPQLVAGPIMRAGDLLHQFTEEHRFRLENLREGMGQILLGFYKKTIIADPAGVLVDQIFADPESYGWQALWISVFLHAMQIYGDFSGYSDIAIGTGRIMGFRSPENFRRPFLAVTMADLWQRWHISLSTWLRDYIYIPLGGGRVSMPRVYVNVFLTMFISGIWHGAGLNFVMWGTFHALVVVIERYILSFKRIDGFLKANVPLAVKRAYTFIMFCFPLFFFRGREVESIGTAAETGWVMAMRALSFAEGAVPLPAWELVAVISGLMLVEMVQERRRDAFRGLLKHSFVFWTLAGVLLAYCALVYAATDSAPFVYFQF